MKNKATTVLIDRLIRSDLKNYYQGDELERVQVDDFVSKVAKIYEKIRNTIEYREDHLMRKSAIFRILQRRLLIKVSIEDVATSLVKELIRAGYLENDLIPREKVAEVEKIILKYLSLYNLSRAKGHINHSTPVFKWIIELAACEIEESLVPPIANKAMVEYMYRVMRPKVNIINKDLTDKEKDLHVYLGIYRSLIKSDDATIDYLLLKYFVPDWRQADDARVMDVAKKLLNLKQKIDTHKTQYADRKLLKLFKKYTFIFHVLREIIMNKPALAQEVFDDPARLELEIRQTCERLYKSTRVKLRRSVIRVTIYLFITKMLLALLLEVPYDRYIAQEFHWLPLIINALVPPTLILMLGLFIKIPSKNNTNKVVEIAKSVVYHNTISDERKGFGVNIKRANVFNIIFYILYFALFMLSFGALIWVLRQLDFNIFGMFIFLFFLSVVSFFGIKMRYKVRELWVLDRKENVLSFLLNLLWLPFVNVGHWMSDKFSKVNILVFFLDFIIEAPFKVFLEVIEDWLAFLKEKKEEIYSKD